MLQTEEEEMSAYDRCYGYRRRCNALGKNVDCNSGNCYNLEEENTPAPWDRCYGYRRRCIS